MSTFNFFADTNWDEVSEAGESKQGLPEGVVKVIITESEVKPGRGKTEEESLVQHITLQCIEGAFKGAETKVYYSLRNPNETAVNIAKSNIKSLCLSIGAFPKMSLAELHKKPFKVKIEHEIRNFVDDRSGQPRQAINAVVKGYYAITTEVVGEDLPQVSTKESLVKLGATTTGVVDGRLAAVPVQGAKPPSAPPTAPSASVSAPKPQPSVSPKAPPVAQVTTTEANVDENQPDWLS
jgi:hypothetical protein